MNISHNFLLSKNLCEFTTRELKNEFNAYFKDFWYPKTSDSDLVRRIQLISMAS